MKLILNFINDKDGLTAIEYVISASLIVAGLTIMFTGFGAALATKFNTIISSF